MKEEIIKLNHYMVIYGNFKIKFSYYFPHTYRAIYEKKFLTKIQIQTVSRCNSRCSFCPYPSVKDEISHGKMDSLLFKKIIDEAAKARVDTIYPYLMNEPLLDSRIFEFIEYIKQKNPKIKVRLETNGSLLNKDRGEKLATSRVDFVGFNVQGLYRETYEANMGLNFEEVYFNINYFLTLERPLCSIIIMVAKNLLAEKEFREYVRYWKTKGVTINIFEFHNRAKNVSDKRLKTAMQKNNRLRGCQGDRHLKWMHILFNGDVVLCCQDWKREIVIGNLEKQSIYEVWNSKRYKEIRKKINSGKKVENNFLCNKCYLAIK